MCVRACVCVCVCVCARERERERERERAELSSSGVGGEVWNKVCVSMLITNQVQIVKFSGCSV